MIRIHIKQLKIDPCKHGVHVSLGKTNNDICPVLAYLVRRRGTRGPLFVMEYGQYLT